MSSTTEDIAILANTIVTLPDPAPAPAPAPAPVECAICTEKYSRVRRLRVQCPYCAFEACSCCCQTFLLSETTPRCMNNDCRREWTRKFVCQTFPMVFVNKHLKKHREQTIYETERALLPATQPIVENILLGRSIQRQVDEINQTINELCRRRNEIWESYRNRNSNLQTTGHQRQFVHACSAPDCRGFLSTQWKCGLCEQWTCPHCYELKGPQQNVPHTCEPDLLASATLMRNDTKSCPKCGVGIFRISGCPQMFCTQCHTAFCWNTGRIETTVHNPHYFEWLQQNRTNGAAAADADERDDNVCGPNGRRMDGRFLNRIRQHFHVLSSHLHGKKGTGKILSESQFNLLTNRLYSNIRAVNHIREVEIPRFQNDPLIINQKLRVRYLMKEIDEEQWKVALQRSEKRCRRNREIFEILDMISQAATDIVYRIYHTVKHFKSPRDDVLEVVRTINANTDEIRTLIVYANRHLYDISMAYNSKPFQFNTKMELAQRDKPYTWSEDASAAAADNA